VPTNHVPVGIMVARKTACSLRIIWAVWTLSGAMQVRIGQRCTLLGLHRVVVDTLPYSRDPRLCDGRRHPDTEVFLLCIHLQSSSLLLPGTYSVHDVGWQSAVIKLSSMTQ
jgi:hypothetical protein